ncbi:lysine/ornithine N-monooxygenase, partial [Gracilibacillus halophilus YIM-C55.5]
KLGQEVFTPDYVNYFHQLSYKKRMESLDLLGQLRKGIDAETLHHIHEWLYHKSVENQRLNVTIQPLTEITKITKNGDRLTVHGEQRQKEEAISFDTDKAILGTGYQPNLPDWFYSRFEDNIQWEDEHQFQVTKNYRLAFKHGERSHHFYTLTNIEHSHGTGATNLGLAVDRNIQIINEVANKTIYPLQRDTTFTQFMPETDEC